MNPKSNLLPYYLHLNRRTLLLVCVPVLGLDIGISFGAANGVGEESEASR
jgi:hypothetical protein